jgi:NADH-quinone oxidoreductase subunit L
MGVFAAFLTATYMFRLLYMTFYGTRRPGSSGAGHGHASTGASASAKATADKHLHDAPPAMAIALVVLTGLAFAGILAGLATGRVEIAGISGVVLVALWFAVLGLRGRR